MSNPHHHRFDMSEQIGYEQSSSGACTQEQNEHHHLVINMLSQTLNTTSSHTRLLGNIQINVFTNVEPAASSISL